MADYFSPTVVQPAILSADMTALERLLLTHIFESEPDGDGLYFFAETSPNTQIELPIKVVRAALAAEEGVASEAAAFVRGQLKDVGDDDEYVCLDLSQTSFEILFQDIVKRSATLDHVSIVTSFTCTKMRPDGFGGMAVLVTADAIKGKSTEDILGDFLDEAEHGPLMAAPGFGVHVLLRLHEAKVRAQIAQIIEADETLTPIAAGAVTDADIRAGCISVVERTDLTEQQDSAVFKAALAAIREAEQRLAPAR
ncbi:MAG: hypothetical protein ACR65T_14005 [Methylocystis sp.]|uniref:hypothetical protein n=1 Tax=Methylocystis sp. TaxID=1911079 RepID=UPI003DA2E272